MPFSDLSDRAQVHRLRVAATETLTRYPITIERLRLLNHDFNTTFRLDAAEGTFAVRIDTNRRKSVGALDAEMLWLEAIARDTEVIVPAPVATVDGNLHVPVEVDGIEGSLNVAVMTWLPGRDLDEPTIAATAELGRQMAMLHDHAASWVVPDAAEFPRIDSVLMDSDDRLRAGHPAIDAAQQRVLAAALDRIEPAFDAMTAAGASMPIHGDLHPWNVKWLRGRMSVFDFDDGGIGTPAQDLTISTFYLPDDEAIRQALLDGYSSVRELPPYTDDEFHAALAARTLLLLNDLLAQDVGESRTLRDRYLINVVARMRAYLDSGRYLHDAPGVVPLR